MDTENNIKIETERIMKIFEGADENKLALLSGAIKENARLRCQLDELNEICVKTGIVKFNPQYPTIHKMTPVFSALIKMRASYLNSIRMLCREMGGNADDFEDDLGDFE